VTRLVDRFGYGWADLVDRLRADGPDQVIGLVRAAELADPAPYGKRHDDATALVLTRG
jgi:hypothetical protein